MGMTTRRQAQGRSKAVRGALLGAAVTTGLLAGTLAAGPSWSAAESSAAGVPVWTGSECAEVREKVERLEGRITPNACAFMKRQIAFGETPTGTPPQQGEVDHPRVETYLDIFDKEATLWEAGAKAQRGHEAIGTSIIGSLQIAPDLRYRGTDVVADGAVVMFGQWNEVTLKGHKVAYPQIARNVLSDDGKTMQARRYYDRHELFKPIAPELRPVFEGVTDTGPVPGTAAAERFRPDEITDRLAAWNSEDVTALTRRMGNARLTGPGLADPLATDEGKRAYLTRLFERADVRLEPGQVAFGATTTYVEWHGTVSGEKGTNIPFGVVERFGPGGEWELSFDTLPLIANRDEIIELFKKLSQP